MLLTGIAIRDIIEQNIISNFSILCYPWAEDTFHQECKEGVDANTNTTFANGIIFSCLVNPKMLKCC